MGRPEELAKQFYEWERLGRGWQLAEYPVSIEPPFEPFLYHNVSRSAVDDGRTPTLLSSFTERIFGPPASAKTLPPPPVCELTPRVAFPLEQRAALVELLIILPPTLQTHKESFEQFMCAVSNCLHPVVFEIVGTEESVIVQIVAEEMDCDDVEAQLAAHYPEAAISRRDDSLRDVWGSSNGGSSAVVDFGLSHEFMVPLETRQNFANDPLIAIMGALVNLKSGEMAILQALWKPVRNPWAESIFRSVVDNGGEAFFANAPELVGQAKAKISQPLYSVALRIAAKADTESRMWMVLKSLSGALTQFADPVGNELIPLTNDGYDADDHEFDLLNRQTRRCGMLLNSNELASLVHLPSASVRSEKLVRSYRKTKAAPVIARNRGVFLGTNTHNGEAFNVSQNAEQRVRHTFVIGASGTGKSTFLLNLIQQDIENGEGLAVLDPHGDLIDQILSRVPENRWNDVILFDPSDEMFPIGFNILSAHSDLEKHLLASDLVAVFKRLSTSWGDQMTSVLGNAILAFLESTRGGTLADMRRFLIEPGFRSEILETVQDKEIVYYWKKEFPLLSGRPQASILTRLDTFLRPKIIRNMVSQKANRLDFAEIMNGKKIFLAKLSQGAIGEENAYLLGTLLVSKFHQMVMSRQAIAAESRQNFWLYIDEFHNFVTPSLAAVLAGARKYRLGLILAHQELHQLQGRDSDVLNAVISNPYTRVCFRLGDSDARKLSEGFTFFEARDLQNLGTGEAICRMERADFDFNLSTPMLPPVDEEMAALNYEKITELSRAKYAVRREDVQAEFASGMEPEKADVLPVKIKSTAEAEIPKGYEKSTLGRGGQHHKYLQGMIKQWAEGMGYRATIEKQILDGEGSVDVALEKPGLLIGCEISISNTVDYEVSNVRKCVSAGYHHVVMVCTDDMKLASVRDAVSAQLSADNMKRVKFAKPNEIFALIQGFESAVNSADGMVRGYRVSVAYKTLPVDERHARRQSVATVFARAIKRSKPENGSGEKP